MKRILLVLGLLFAGAGSFAQQYRPVPSAEIYRKLQQLNVLGTVMYVAAHPDDENTRLLSYLVHHDHVRAMYLSLTRGDGGQNILGNEQGSTLGLIRTHELMEARKIDGAEQLFSHVIDFGFSKNPDETFQFWKKDELVKDVMATMQRYRPDVVICRFPTTGEGGHGQHTASAIVAEEAFKMLEKEKSNESDNSKVWVPTRLLFNSFRFGDRNTTSEDQFKFPINQYDPLLGEGYGEMAGRSRSIHRSQGAGTPQSVGASNEYFKLLGGKPMRASLYDDIDISWNRVGRPDIGTKIQQIIQQFDFVDPSRSLPALVALKKEIEKVEDYHWRIKKLAELNDIVSSCAGIMVEALANSQEAVAGAELPVSLQVIARSITPVQLEGASFGAAIEQGSARPCTLVSDSLYKFTFKIKINEKEPETEPYWLRYPGTVGAYEYDADKYAGLPVAGNYLTGGITFSVLGERFSAHAPISYKRLDPVKGDVVQRLRIVPAVSIGPVHSLLVFETGRDKKAWLRIRSFKQIEQLEIRVKESGKVIHSVALGNLEQGKDTLIMVDVPTGGLSGTDDKTYVTFEAVADGAAFSRSMHLLQYDHLPELQYFTGSWMKVLKKDWKTAVKKIGYVEGAGDYVDGILDLCGLDVEHLNNSALSNPQTLQSFDAIVLGIRALNTEKQMNAWMPALLQYVENGGTLLVQYNTNQNLVTRQLGPYPFTLTRNRVTEEEAAVTITQPNARLLQYPNKISQQDFDNWVQERGLYFPAEWDKRYQTLFSMHDKGEQPLESAVLYAPYGKGHFIYTSLAFFRQLPAGNVGAIRLMMNLLSAGK
jgi:LmbE family N-acetylglucosaminyl deacetylase